MSWAINDLRKQVDRYTQVDDQQVRDKSLLIDDAIDAALERYNRDAPKHYVWTRTGVAGGQSRYDLPSQFDPEFSVITQIEKPTEQVPPDFLQPKQYQVYPNDYTTYQLLFLDSAPDDTVTFAVTMTVKRELANVKTSHKKAFAYLAASFMCDSVAASMANQQESTVSTDTVDHEQGESSWTRRSREFLKRYEFVVLPKEDKQVEGAEVTVAVESPFARTSSRIFHKD